MKSQYHIVQKKLNEFIRKYHLNQITRGLFLTLSIALIYLLLLLLGEYYFYFSTSTKTRLLMATLFVFSGVLVYFIIWPGLRLLQIAKGLDYKSAANILSNNFNEISDKLLNTIELAELSNKEQNLLLIASINQRVDQLRPIPFIRAIDFRNSYKWLLVFVGIFIISATAYLINPDFYKNSSYRLVNYKQEFVKPAPYRFILLNDDLEIRRGNDIEVRVKLEGDYLPSRLAIILGGNQYSMVRQNNNLFSYQIKNLNNSVNFNFTDGGYMSETHRITSLAAPVINNFVMEIVPPAYTGIKPATLENVGDAAVPEGTILTWNFNTVHANLIYFTHESASNDTLIIDNKVFTLNKTIKSPYNYGIVLQNENFTDSSTLNYSIRSIPDLAPAINVMQLTDSLSLYHKYFYGSYSDDYGFTALNFVFRVGEGKPTKIPLQFNKNTLQNEFYFNYDLTNAAGNNKQAINYYFEVTDNDRINGYKTTRSSEFRFMIPDKAELSKLEERSNERIEENMENSMEISKEIQDKLDEMYKDVFLDNKNAWERDEQLSELLQKQQDLEELIKQLKRDNEQKNLLENQLGEKNEELLKKQQELQELMDQLMDDELKALFEELQKLKEEFDENKFNQLKDNMQMKMEDFEKELDRNLELLKRYEIEKNMERSIDDLQKLAQEQRQLRDSVNRNSENNQQNAEKNLEQQQEFSRIEEKYREMLKKNSQLEKPFKMEEFEQQFQQIHQQFDQNSDNLENNQQKKSKEGLQQNSENLEQFAQKMQQMMDENMQEQTARSISELRQILDNLLHFSFAQEELMLNFKTINRFNPKYVDYTKTQKKLEDDFAIIKDSLISLGKSNAQLSRVINEDVDKIGLNLRKSLKALEERLVQQAGVFQQYSMTSANNLALLLHESLDNLKNQQQQAGSGKDDKNKKPGNGQPSMMELKEQQQSMKSQMEDLIKQMKEGKGSKQQQNALNKRLAEMLAKQEIFQQQLNQLNLDSDFSPQTQRKLNEIQRMIDENIRELVTKNVSQETLKRQQEILTRLLEAENSEREREKDKKRESKTGMEIENTGVTPELFYEQLKKLPYKQSLYNEKLLLNDFYKLKMKQYQQKLQ